MNKEYQGPIMEVQSLIFVCRVKFYYDVMVTYSVATVHVVLKESKRTDIDLKQSSGRDIKHIKGFQSPDKETYMKGPNTESVKDTYLVCSTSLGI